ncbi:MAG: hypothetical protein JSW18_00135, partial [Candidatus Omnitrophota bacterium]
YTYSAGLSHDFDILYFSLGYFKTIVSDRIEPSEEKDSDAISASLDGNFIVKEVEIAWNFSEDVEHVTYKEVREADFICRTNAGIKFIFPSTLTFETQVGFYNNDYYLNDTDNNDTEYFIGVSRNLYKDNLAFDLSYERKSYNYADGDDNYAENIITGKLSYVY